MKDKSDRRGSAAAPVEEKTVSARSAFVVVSIILALIVAIYILSVLGSRTAAYVPRNQPPQQNWSLSPLIGQYGIMSVPTLVINCKYMLIGSLAYGENMGTVPQGTERSRIGGALCTATNNSVFCSRFGKVPLTVLNLPECKSGNKSLVYAFNSWNCQYSQAQRDVLDAFSSEFQSDVKLEYICTPRNQSAQLYQSDMEDCSKEFLMGMFSQ